jgi:hypothetical protein
MLRQLLFLLTAFFIGCEPQGTERDPSTPGDDGNGVSYAAGVADACECLASFSEGELSAAIADVEAARPSVAQGGAAACFDVRAGMIMRAASGTAPAIPSFPPRARTGVPPRRTGRDVVERTKAAGIRARRSEAGRMLVVRPERTTKRDGEASADLEYLARSVDDALEDAVGASQTCHALAVAQAFATVGFERDMPANHGLRNLSAYIAREKRGLRRALAAANRADNVAAAATTLAAALHAGVASGSGVALERTAAAINGALPTRGTTSDAELKAVLARGGEQNERYMEWLKGVMREHRESSRLHGESNRQMRTGAPAALMTAQEASDTTAVTEALLGAFSGDVGAIIRGAAVLFPKDSPIRHGLAATGALVHGDVLGAARSAAKMVPKDSSMGQALAVADAALEIAGKT